MVAVLKACGDNLIREKCVEAGGQHPKLKAPDAAAGVTLSTSADDFAPIKQMQLQNFDDTTWKPFGVMILGSGN
jgi:branched-chain amino acid transport system substrate-binding protein